MERATIEKNKVGVLAAAFLPAGIFHGCHPVVGETPDHARKAIAFEGRQVWVTAAAVQTVEVIN